MLPFHSGISLLLLANMEMRALTVFCTFFLCSGVVFSMSSHQGFSGLEARFRNLSLIHHSTYPLYMMQLYRSFKAADSSSSAAVNGLTTQGGGPSAHRSDSVLNLMARGE